jgi:5-methyltetrahydrofolate--homocysteine methyltransferase
VDLGADVPADKFVAAINEHRPQLVGMSALLTTTIPMMRTILMPKTTPRRERGGR